MTNDLSSDTTATTTVTDTGTNAEMEVAGPPSRARDASTKRRRRALVALVVGTTTVGALWAVTGSSFHRPATSTTPGTTPGRPVPPGPAATAAPPSPIEALDALPEGFAPTIPYLRGGELHVGDLTARTNGNRLLSGGGTVLVGRSGNEHARWWILDGADLVTVPELDDVLAPSLSPSGHLLVWTSYPDGQTTRVVAWSPSARAELDHVDVAAPHADCCGGGQEIEIIGLDTDDQVYWTSRHGYQVWRPWSGGTPQRLTGIDAIHQVSPVGPVHQGGVLGQVDERGRWTRLADLPTDQGMVWSADGSVMAYGGDATGSVALKQAPTDVWVIDPMTGARTRLAVPDGLRAEAVGFESDQWLMVEAFASPRHHQLLRCSVRDGSCERTLAPGRWILPERSAP